MRRGNNIRTRHAHQQQYTRPLLAGNGALIGVHELMILFHQLVGLRASVELVTNIGKRVVQAIDTVQIEEN